MINKSDSKGLRIATASLIGQPVPFAQSNTSFKTPALLSFAAGAWVLQQFSSLPDMYWLCMIIIAAIFALRKPFWVAGLFLLGFTWAALVAHLTLADALTPQLVGQDIFVRGTVADIPRKNSRGVQFEFKIAVPNRPKEQTLPSLVRLNWYEPSASQLKAGQIWELTIRLKQPRGTMNPGGFDYEKWLFSRGIRATGYVRHTAKNRMIKQTRWALNFFRQHLYDRLNGVLSARPAAGVISALTLGIRADISPRQWEVFRRTATSHLVAISGLHIGLIAGLTFWLTQWLWALTGVLKWSPPKTAAIVSGLAALIYAALAGFSIPTQRALIMIAVAMGGIFLQRSLNGWRVLAVGMFSVVVFDPIAVVQPGFWLSFGAVALIVFSLAGRIGRPAYWRDLIKIQLVLSVGMAPILAYHFQQISLVAPLANLVVVPLFSFVIVPLCLAGVLLLNLLPVLASHILRIGDALLEGVWWFLERISTTNSSQWDFSQPSIFNLFLAMAGVFIITAPRGIPARWVGLVLLIPLASPKRNQPAEGDVLFALLDVGQGLAATVMTRAHTLVFDTGARFSDRFDMGEAVVSPFLKYRGIEAIDVLVISHDDNDHIGGAGSLQRNFAVNETLTSVPGLLPWPNVNRCYAGQTWIWDQVEFSMVSPTPPGYRGDNDNSCVLKVSAAGGSILLTGDIERTAERGLVRYHSDLLKSDILVVPHHGSATSSTRLFLDYVEPRFALIPSGFYNRYGFPHADVIGRYQEVGTTVLQTGEMGAIQIEITQNGITAFDAYRVSHRSYWHAN